MPITYRAEKGSPLSVEEIDGNFRELDNRLKNLEENPEVGESIGKIQVEGDQIHFRGTFATDFGTFTLPSPTLKLKGKWMIQTFYQTLDLVTHETGLYSCLHAHTSITWEQDINAWQEIFALPKPPPPSLHLYEKATLPQEEILGKMAILVGEEEPALIFFNGKTWQHLMKGDTL